MAKDTLIAKDKLKHFLACFFASIINPLLAVLLAVAKEYIDSKTEGNHWCWLDIIADAFGILLGSVAWYFLWFRIIEIF